MVSLQPHIKAGFSSLFLRSRGLAISANPSSKGGRTACRLTRESQITGLVVVLPTRRGKVRPKLEFSVNLFAIKSSPEQWTQVVGEGGVSGSVWRWNAMALVIWRLQLSRMHLEEQLRQIEGHES